MTDALAKVVIQQGAGVEVGGRGIPVSKLDGHFLVLPFRIQIARG